MAKPRRLDPIRSAGLGVALVVAMAGWTTVASRPAADGKSVVPKIERGYELVPASGADGEFEPIEDAGVTILRSLASAGGFSPYLYFRLPEDAPREPEDAYLELTYKDVGAGRLRVEYNARDQEGDHRPADLAYGASLGDSGRVRTAVFRLPRPRFRGRQNLAADLRVCSPSAGVRLHVVKAVLFDEPTPLFRERDAKPWLAPYAGPTRSDVDTTTLRRKVLCGYQGWFRCPGDPAEQGWRHWSRDSSRITPDSLTFEMWPEMGEYPDDERYPAPGFTGPDGKSATLFSSDNQGTVDRHFRWMREYGIDGVFAQRFLVHVGDPSFDRILAHVRDSANRTGRVFAVGYDLSGTPEDRLFDRLADDWKRLVDEMQLTRDKRYLHHDGKPVLFVWGFFSDRFGPATAHRLIDFLKGDPKYAVTLVGGCPWHWRSERDPEWARAFRRFDVISPWNVGNVEHVGGQKHAATGYWKPDLVETKRAGMGYLPVIYPGFGWTNLKGRRSASATIPRLGGAFFWRQFATAADLGVEMAYVAMFDEVDEGTAIFKVSNTPPTPGRFATYEGLPPDWYLRLTGEGSRLIRGDRENSRTIPIRP